MRKLDDEIDLLKREYPRLCLPLPNTILTYRRSDKHLHATAKAIVEKTLCDYPDARSYGKYGRYTYQHSLLEVFF